MISTGRARRVLTLIVGAGLASCGTGSESASEGTDMALRHGGFHLSNELELTITLPAGATLDTLSAGAEEGLTAGDHVQAEAKLTTAEDSVCIGAYADLAGVISSHDLTLGYKSEVSGDLVAAGVIHADGSTVGGSKHDHANLGPDNVFSWSVPAGPADAGPVMVAVDGVADIDPGSYSELKLRKGSSVTLHTGVYRFEHMTLDDESELVIDSRLGPVQVYTAQDFVFRGSVTTATVGIPQLLLAKIGAGKVEIAGDFTGVMVAPSALLHVGTPPAFAVGHYRGHHERGFGFGAHYRHHWHGGFDDRHHHQSHELDDQPHLRAVVYGKDVSIAAGVKLDAYPFDWGGVAPGLEPPPKTDLPTRTLARSPLDMPVVSRGDAASAPADSTSTPPIPVTFKMPDDYPVQGGTLANHCITFTYVDTSSSTVTCTYCGGSSTDHPTTALELNLGRTLTFQGCSDGLPASTPRTGTSFTLHVDPVPGLPVTVNAPVTQDGACSESLELLTPAQTQQMRESFTWGSRSHVAATNPDKTPTLYYAWVLLRTKEDAINLRRLFIHQLKRPLFTQELEKFSGRCGTITNPGDGFGTFVPVLIPGATYNRLIDLQTAKDISGDRTIFDAIIIRNDVPDAARNENGSVRLDVLANAGFSYLDYEQRPLADYRSINLDGGSVVRALIGALQYVAEAARNAAELVTNVIADIDKLLRGTVRVKLDLRVIVNDHMLEHDAQGGAVIRHAWGDRRGRPLGVSGLEVSILQKFLDTPIPETSQGNTAADGTVSIDAVEGGNVRGSGLCIELKTDSAQITDFLVANDFCDFTFWGSNDKLPIDFDHDSETHLDIEGTRLIGLYEADDVYQWSRRVAGFTPPRARILSGSWAELFSPSSDTNPDEDRLWTPCLNFGTSPLDSALSRSLEQGWLGHIFHAAEDLTAGTFMDLFRAILLNDDIVMPEASKLPVSRVVMSHEYGHYVLCSLVDDAKNDALGEMIDGIIFEGRDFSDPRQYANEAFAEFIAGQTTGAADYSWPGANNFFNHEGHRDYYGVPSTIDPTTGLQSTDPALFKGPLFDDNQFGVADNDKDKRSIGRVATLLHDVFDGHGQPLEALVPNDAALWQQSVPVINLNMLPSPDDGQLVLWGADFTNLDAPPRSLPSFGSTDEALERVAAPASGIKSFGKSFAQALITTGGGIDSDFTDSSVYGSVNQIMKDNGQNWCERCRVFALHTPNWDNSGRTVRDMIQRCLSDPLLSVILNDPPEAYGRLDAATIPGPGNPGCQVCPSGEISNENGECVPCPAAVHGDSCDICPSDVIVTGDTIPIDQTVEYDPTTPPDPSDPCPELFYVEFQNAPALLQRGAKSLSASARPETLNKALCERPYELIYERNIEGTFVLWGDLQDTGVYHPACSGGGKLCLEDCDALPSAALGAADLGTLTSARFAMPSNDATKRLVLSATTTVVVR